uniref:Uncharacterized protein n=1 Tax=Erythrolobus madagascarensis TaxID=708628 RepID=A0A7S0XJD2_9RHOD|mmetsp:Transcript_3842/g.8462  ORF Transcript_3842/g.8462 Transcript_3842/m.8462 type:complete len:158 (+) Transcript_3842:167-640(+)
MLDVTGIADYVLWKCLGLRPTHKKQKSKRKKLLEQELNVMDYSSCVLVFPLPPRSLEAPAQNSGGRHENGQKYKPCRNLPEGLSRSIESLRLSSSRLSSSLSPASTFRQHRMRATLETIAEIEDESDQDDLPRPCGAAFQTTPTNNNNTQTTTTFAV